MICQTLIGDRSLQ